MKKNNIIIKHEKLGVLFDESIEDTIQFKLFLNFIHSSLELKNDLTFFNGQNFLIHIPYKILKVSLIISKTEKLELSDHLKSKVLSLQNK